MKFKFQLDPLTRKQLRRFRSIKRGYYSFIILIAIIFLSFFSELFINSRALLVKYEGQYFFPTYGAIIPGSVFGLGYEYETNYRKLKTIFENQSGGKNFVIMPIAPYNPYENDFQKDGYPPFPPSAATQHYLGTDVSGRDITARLAYGFRIAICFSIILLLCNYLVGISIGCAMGYFGGKFDILFQRLIEIWANIPFLYVIIIVASIMVPTFLSLIVIMVFFGWIYMTWQLRTTTYKEKAKEYVMAARSLGAGHTRIIFKHIIPNSVSIIVTFIPFSISAGVASLTSLDYLGFGLPAPTPSWGELLKQGTDNMEASWISIPVIASMISVLVMITFIGEAVREAFDPKRHTTYE